MQNVSLPLYGFPCCHVFSFSGDVFYSYILLLIILYVCIPLNTCFQSEAPNLTDKFIYLQHLLNNLKDPVNLINLVFLFSEQKIVCCNAHA